MTREASDHDPVHSPSHYTSGSIECIDAIEAALTPAEARGFRKGNAMKYIWRAGRKGSYEEDLGKANWYLERERVAAKKNGDESCPEDSDCEVEDDCDPRYNSYVMMAKHALDKK